MPRPTARGLAVLVLAVVVYFAARTVGTWELYLVSLAFGAAVVGSWLMMLATRNRLGAERFISPLRPVAGEEPRFTITVSNRSLIPSPQLTLTQPLEGLTAEDVALELESLGPRGRRAVNADSGRVRRGVYRLPPIDCEAEDFLGLARSHRFLGETLAVTVHPRIAHLRSCNLFPDLGRKREAWSHGLLMPGNSEFRGIRPHHPGEPLSHVDWKATARTGALMLREMDEPMSSHVTILLDGTAGSVVGDPPDTNYELAVQAAGSIADFALRSGRAVDLLSHERSFLRTRLGPDIAGRRLLLETLAAAKPNAVSELTSSLRNPRSNGSQLFRTQYLTLITISLDRQLVRSILALKEEGLRVSVVYVVGASFVLKPTGRGDKHAVDLPYLAVLADRGNGGAKDGAARAAELPSEATTLLLSLAAAGVTHRTLVKGGDLRSALSERRDEGRGGRVR